MDRRLVGSGDNTQLCKLRQTCAGESRAGRFDQLLPSRRVSDGLSFLLERPSTTGQPGIDSLYQAIGSSAGQLV